MTRDCYRCGFTLSIDQFPTLHCGNDHRHVCHDCWAANELVWRVAAVAGNGLVRLRAIDALLGMGYTRGARLIASGATYWPSIRELREGTGMPRQSLWWISFDADTIALMRMLLRTPELKRTPVVVCAA